MEGGLREVGSMEVVEVAGVGAAQGRSPIVLHPYLELSWTAAAPDNYHRLPLRHMKKDKSGLGGKTTSGTLQESEALITAIKQGSFVSINSSYK